MRTQKSFAAALAAVAIASFATPALAQDAGKNGTTLAASKTIDICSVSDGVWRYSGVVSVWNEGELDTAGLSVLDTIQHKVGNKWLTLLALPELAGGQQIPAGTTKEDATTFAFSIDGPSTANTVRNSAKVTILNHSGSLGRATGPEPKMTFLGTVEPCPVAASCVYTQGYWGSKPDVVWPAPYSRDDAFFGNTQTWQQVMDNSVAGGNAYYMLAHQYIAAVLNKANGAPVPEGIQATLDLATGWFAAGALPASCPKGSSCGLQKTWAATLDQYNNGTYPGGPAHCE